MFGGGFTVQRDVSLGSQMIDLHSVNYQLLTDSVRMTVFRSIADLFKQRQISAAALEILY